MKFEDKVKQGVEVLDRHFPGWEKQIDVDKLELDSCSECVLGQLFQDYTKGLYKLDLDEGYNHGFDLPRELHGKVSRDAMAEWELLGRSESYGETHARLSAPYWDDLRLAWVEQIKRRLE